MAKKQEREEINVLMKERATRGKNYELYIFSEQVQVPIRHSSGGNQKKDEDSWV